MNRFNQTRLQEAEASFLQRYPLGFHTPEIEAVVKKHKMPKMLSAAQESFAKERFKDPMQICEDMVKQVSRSSMVSLFEKPKFRDYVATLDSNEKSTLSEGLFHFLHGDQRAGFEAIVSMLKPAKLAKWSLLTIVPNYFSPDQEIFVKPTTTKGIIKHFELEGITYHPTPSWAFYEAYRAVILEMKSLVSEDLGSSNAAFCGFLMMCLPE